MCALYVCVCLRARTRALRPDASLLWETLTSSPTVTNKSQLGYPPVGEWEGESSLV
jgi:hypothetical protein